MVLMISPTTLVVWTCFATALVVLAYVSVASSRIRKQALYFTADQVVKSMLQTYTNVFVPIIVAVLFFSFLVMFKAPPVLKPTSSPEERRLSLKRTLPLFETKSLAVFALKYKWPVSQDTARITEKQIHCLALNMYHESRGELNQTITLFGRQLNQAELVAEVTLRRAHSSGQNICQTVYQSSQFSWTVGSVDVEEYRTYQMLYRVAEARLKAYRNDGKTPLPINHFYSHKVLKTPPEWATGMKIVAVVGSHTYLYSSTNPSST